MLIYVMQEPLDRKMYFYFDESGSPAILGHHGKNLLEKGLTSKIFLVGYVQTENPHDFLVGLENLRRSLMHDEYSAFAGGGLCALGCVPSIRA